MIWLFKIDEVFWDNKPKVDEHYVFDTTDINFDIINYDISLYFGTANYYLLSESNNREIYWLRFEGVNNNPRRILISDDSESYNIIRNFYIENQRDNKINNLIK